MQLCKKEWLKEYYYAKVGKSCNECIQWELLRCSFAEEQEKEGGVSVKTALHYSNLKMHTVAVAENLFSVAMKTT